MTSRQKLYEKLVHVEDAKWRALNGLILFSCQIKSVLLP